MAIIARMDVTQVIQNGYRGGQTSEEVHLQAVYSENPESPNFKWSKATPSGSLHLTIDNEAAFGKLKPGDEVTVTITKVKS